ncbi:solute carrier family facilitated glucose transporter member 1-like [Brachionus plicatilis]|uniref:Solute carrier family facilitated glucose transporter member 1-like n=1 Tax=Brachionus plicatilis TaxID=10195 RepID=A0A3M7RV09_BRAPC|nr:solute carrier family facilitated glucose transporter member 1-like [Brachionus plicatilis]
MALTLCCLCITLASFQFGYNISALNSPSSLIKSFIKNETYIFKPYYEQIESFKSAEQNLLSNNFHLEYEKKEFKKIQQELSENLFSSQKYKKFLNKKFKKENEISDHFNTSMEEYLEKLENLLVEEKLRLEKFKLKLIQDESEVNEMTEIVWTILNSLFVLGGMTGAFGSKFIMDKIGRKMSMVLHNLFSTTASILVASSTHLSSPVLVLISRFFFGIQGGFACSIVPTYLSEIAPNKLRGRIGVLHQLFITLGIVSAQVIGFRQILGSQGSWNYLLAVPIIPALVGSIALLLFFPESPKALLIKNKADLALEALRILRHEFDVKWELQEMDDEIKKGDCGKVVSIIGLFQDSELRLPLFTALVLQASMQLCGVNAVTTIFKESGIENDYIQYAIFTTGLVNILATFVCVPLIDKLGRRPLLLVSLAVMIINYIFLVVSLTLKKKYEIMSYISLVCILIFILSFAVSLGPIPYVYAAECFRQNSRSSAMALCSLVNWTSSLVLTLMFPFLQRLIHQYVFLVFTAIVSFSFLVIAKKVPETKGKSIDQIMKEFNS